jgi:hypothetical protein
MGIPLIFTWTVGFFGAKIGMIHPQMHVMYALISVGQ